MIRFRRFAADQWNVVDTLIVALSLAALGPINLPVNILRLLRACRVIRIARKCVRVCVCARARVCVRIARKCVCVCVRASSVAQCASALVRVLARACLRACV